MFKRTPSEDVGNFAIELVEEFSRRCPVDRPAGELRALGLAQAIDETCNRAAAFQKARQLGVYGRAKLGTEFKLKMEELGYPTDFVDELTGRLLMSMSGK